MSIKFDKNFRYLCLKIEFWDKKLIGYLEVEKRLQKILNFFYETFYLICPER